MTVTVFCTVLILMSVHGFKALIGSSSVCVGDYVRCCSLSPRVNYTCSNEWFTNISACETVMMQISGVWVCVSNCSSHTIQDLSCETCMCHNCYNERWNNCTCDYCYELSSMNNAVTNSTSTGKPDNANDKIVIAASVGGAIGGCVLVSVIIGAIICCHHRQARQSQAQSSGAVGKNVQPQGLGEKVYENHDSTEMTKKIIGQDLANATKSDLSKLLEEVEVVSLGIAPKVPTTKNMVDTFKRDLSDESHDHEVCIDMNSHNISLERDYVNIKNISKVYAGGSKNNQVKDQKKSSDSKPNLELKSQKASKTDQSVTVTVTVGNESDLEDYENTKELKKLTVLDKNKTNNTLAVANSTSERKENDSDSDDYENTQELSKTTGSSTRKSAEKANKNKVTEREAKEKDCDLDDYENIGPLHVKSPPEMSDKTNNIAEIKTGNVKVERKDNSKEYNTATAPDKNVTNEQDNYDDYENTQELSKKTGSGTQTSSEKANKNTVSESEAKENDCDLDDYENTGPLQVKTLPEVNDKTNNVAEIKTGNVKVERKDNSKEYNTATAPDKNVTNEQDNYDDYENTQELSKKTGSSTQTSSEKANKNTVSESEAKENDCDLDDYENTGPLQVKTLPEVNDKTNNVAEIKTGNVKVERKDNSKEYNTATAPDKNVTNKQDDDSPYQNMTFVRKK